MVCTSSLSLDKQKKNSLVDFIHFRSLFLFAFKTRSVFFGPEERVFFRKKKRNTSPPAKLCCFDSFFGEGARAFRKRKRERETESFFCDEREREISSTFR